MRSLVFEGDSWGSYGQLRRNDKKLHDNLRKILKEMLRDDPKVGIGNQKFLSMIYLVFGLEDCHQKID